MVVLHTMIVFLGFSSGVMCCVSFIYMLGVTEMWSNAIINHVLFIPWIMWKVVKQRDSEDSNSLTSFGMICNDFEVF